MTKPDSTTKAVTHTPAPWTRDGFRIVRVTGDPTDPDSFEAESIATVASDPRRRLERSEANANLIAAAPDLLKVAHAAFHALKAYQYGNTSPDLAESVTEALSNVLARAEGRA